MPPRALKQQKTVPRWQALTEGEKKRKGKAVEDKDADEGITGVLSQRTGTGKDSPFDERHRALAPQHTTGQSGISLGRAQSLIRDR